MNKHKPKASFPANVGPHDYSRKRKMSGRYGFDECVASVVTCAYGQAQKWDYK